MLEIKGIHNSAVVFTDELEPGAEKQIRELCDQPTVAGFRIRIMPDVHVGIVGVVGTTMTLTDKVIPNLVGVDIGCGIETARLDISEIDCALIDKIVYEEIPSGFCVRESRHPLSEEIDLSRLKCAKCVNLERAYKSLGTLGGGNHFIEVNRDGEGGLYIVVHSGSRNLGNEVAGYYQEAGYKQLLQIGNAERENLIEEYKRAGKEREIKSAIRKLGMEKKESVSKNMAYVSGVLFEDYLHDMKLTQRFADVNRKAIMDILLRGLGAKAESAFTTVHNYIDTDAMILRKGAVSAKAGERLIIPMNMRDGSLICVGKGSAEWNFSAPHGAGRLMSRADARRGITMADYRASMEGIYSTSVNLTTLDEAPMAYKAADDIVSRIGDTADVIARLTPIYNFKAAG